METQARGKFVVFEGADDCGKSTMCRMLDSHLKSTGKLAYLTREPGGTPYGEQFRTILKDRTADEVLTLAAETLLFFASRAQLVVHIKNLLAQGYTVICDRWAFSTYAYQCCGKNFSVNALDQLMHISGASSLVPDFVFHMTSSKPFEPRDAIEHEYAQVRPLIIAALENMFSADYVTRVSRVFPYYSSCVVQTINIDNLNPDEAFAIVCQTMGV